MEMWDENVVSYAHRTEQRTGQALFNLLPNPVGDIVAGLRIDPFHREMTAQEIDEWISNHLIFDNDFTKVIAVFNLNQFLWEGE